MAELSQAQKDKLKGLMGEFKQLQKQLRLFITRPDTKTSSMECWRSKSLNIR